MSTRGAFFRTAFVITSYYRWGYPGRGDSRPLYCVTVGTWTEAQEACPCVLVFDDYTWEFPANLLLWSFKFKKSELHGSAPQPPVCFRERVPWSQCRHFLLPLRVQRSSEKSCIAELAELWEGRLKALLLLQQAEGRPRTSSVQCEWKPRPLPWPSLLLQLAPAPRLAMLWQHLLVLEQSDSMLLFLRDWALNKSLFKF